MNLLEIQPHVVSESLNDKIFLLYGEAGTRKTTVATGFEDSLLAAFEIGYKFINGVKAQPLQTWSDFRKFVRALKNPKVKDVYKTIIIDTVSLAYSACYDYILTQAGVEDPGDIGYGKGWRLIRKEFEKLILSIPQMGYGLVLIAHADEFEGNEEKKASTKVDIDKRPAAIIKGLADFIFYVRHEYKENLEHTPENKTVYAYTNLVGIESKTRSRYFTPKFEFTFKNLQAEMKKAINQQKKVEGIITVDHQEVNLHEIVEEELDTVKENIRELAVFLIDGGHEDVVNHLVMDILGKSVTESDEIDKPQLIVLRERLIEVKSKLD